MQKDIASPYWQLLFQTRPQLQCNVQSRICELGFSVFEI